MKLKSTPKELSALTKVELLVVVAVIAITGLTLLAQNMSTDPRVQTAQCRSNLKQIGLSFRVWEGDYGNRYPMSVSKDKGGSMECGAGPEMFMSFRVMSNELNNAAILHCPADDRAPSGSFAALNNNNLSYFVGLDADESRPAMFLAGDRNLATNGVDVVPGLGIFHAGLVRGLVGHDAQWQRKLWSCGRQRADGIGWHFANISQQHRHECDAACGAVRGLLEG